MASFDRRLKSTSGFYKNHVKKFYEDAHRAKVEKRPVAWVASTFPIETLQAMDVVPVWPENYASVCAARQISVELCERAEHEGFSRDLCSYSRCVLGSMFGYEKELPEGGLPKPDFLVATSAACDTHLKWFQVASRIYKAPLFLLDVPYNTGGGDSDHLDKANVEYYVSQLEELFEFLERQTGKKLDMYKLSETLEVSNWTSKLWMEIQDYRKAIPSPMDARDAFSAVFFMLCMPGSQLAVDYYTQLRDELRQRVQEGIGVIEDERFRLVWDNLPLWYNLKIFEYLNGLGAVVVAEVFSHTWAGSLDSSKPFESLARKYLPNMANSTIQRRINIIMNLVTAFQANGLILPTNRGCRMMSIGETIVRDKVYDGLGVHSLIIDVDSSDWRVAGEAQVKDRFATFLETLKKSN
jgi:benzoyl-CoA reductase/2-hydroxyglutaryl-CoA dehydratase subunit BcrC/BadD/HgdB